MGNLNKSIRINTTPGGTDKYLNIKLEQNFDFLEVLSLKISQEDLYTSFCSNYGVIVGRVIANKGFGIPNAKVSIFIPLTDEDERNELIRDLYPYRSVTDKDNQGIRYNLLLSQATCELNASNGTFPTKETLLNNDIVIEVFDKYYRYTTKTNESGDYMLFGVPVGSRILHMDVDLSDAGLLSVRPYDLIAQGAPEKFFDGLSKFKSSTNLDTLPQIKSTNQNVDVIPFWGDPESCEIGITRLDIDTNVELEPNALFMGSIFSDKEKNNINKNCNPSNNMGELDELRTGSGTIQFIRAKNINPIEWVNNKEIVPTELEFFDVSGGDLIDEDGTFVVSLPMNVGRVITNEFGQLIPSPNPEVGLPTKAMYRMKMAFNEQPQNQKRRTASMIFPSLSRDHGGTAGFSSTGDPNDINGTEDQRFTDNLNSYKDIEKDFHLFEWKQLYTIAQYIKKYKKGSNRWSFLGLKNTDKNNAENNPFPFNTAIKKSDLLFSLGSFFTKIGAAFIKFFVILLGLEFGFYFGIKVSIFGICLFRFYRVIRIAPFSWIGDLLGKFCNDPDEDFCCQLYGSNARGFTLSCGDDIFCIRTDENPCGTGNSIPCAGTNNCDDGQNCYPSGPNTLSSVSFISIQETCGCPQDTDNPSSLCSEDGLCLKGYSFIPNINNCTALQTVEDWLCCSITALAEDRNVIRRSLFDAWIVGTSYLFQYKYKARVKSDGTKKEKFCGPGSDTKGGNNYHKNKCCPHDEEPNNECAKCLIRGSEKSDKNYSRIEDYHKTWHNATVEGNCDGLPCGNGATDIEDNIYCNAYNSTKIVSLGRVEMCPDTLNEIERCIQAQECVFDLYKQNPQFFVGTFYEEGWDPNFWVDVMGNTSYENPEAVIRWLISLNSCSVDSLFRGSSGCHDKELEDDYYQWFKEVSKIYNEVVIGQTDPNSTLDQFDPGQPIIESVDNTTTPATITYDEDELGIINSGYVFDPKIGQRFSPCGGNTGVDCNQPPQPWSGEDTQSIEQGPGSNHNASKNIPYYYFGLVPGRTAIDKLRKQFFLN
jgi:hypothetical protein